MTALSCGRLDPEVAPYQGAALASRTCRGRLVATWPRDTRFGRRCFELLSRTYVEARCSSKYAISDEELQWLVARVKDLQQLVETICKECLGS
ncbi:hypothetical protein [Rhizobium sullae]|uniref:hypothetical protein n=1 Tax=Rhizobium sullae TaxID=50338 RepID=UPI001FCD5B3C|nr:hypothetical protein [Rhizobium sullae]